MTYFDNSSTTPMTRGLRKPFSGGIGASHHFLTDSSLAHSLPSSEVFPAVAGGDDDPYNFRDMEGPTMRELMDMERAARMPQEAAPATNA